MVDNTHLAWIDVDVVPSARRRGVGSALLAALHDELRSQGRSTDQVEVARPYDDEAADVAGACFARANAYGRAQTEVHYVLNSPLGHALLSHLRDEIDAHVDGYRIVSWNDRCPDEWVAQLCALEESFNALTPLGDLDLEPETWSEQRLRDNEAARLERGQHTFTSVAVAPDGSLAGQTELLVSSKTVRGGVFQSGTLVHPAHRGHRLGLALKVANQERLQAAEPVPRLVHTYNAAENAPMIAVNSRLGFTAVEYVDAWQRQRD